VKHLNLCMCGRSCVLIGTRESHVLVVAVDEHGLELAPVPFVVQEYTNHGAVLYKVRVFYP
jgi:hypothetical protein